MLLNALLVLAVSGEALPAEPDAQVEPPALIEGAPAQSCPSLFGGDADRERNRAWRGEVLKEVVRGQRYVDVVHTVASWRSPKSIRVPGLDILEVGADEQGVAAARVRVDDAVAQGCGGELIVRADDALGADGQILAVMDEGVLAEHRGQLVLLHRVGNRPPENLRLIWQSGFGLARSGAASRVATTSGAPVETAASGRGTSKSEAARATTNSRTGARAAPKPPRVNAAPRPVSKPKG
jgi:hypothetical protein